MFWRSLDDKNSPLTTFSHTCWPTVKCRHIKKVSALILGPEEVKISSEPKLGYSTTPNPLLLKDFPKCCVVRLDQLKLMLNQVDLIKLEWVELTETIKIHDDVWLIRELLVN